MASRIVAGQIEMAYLWVAIGGALGSMARYGCGGWVARLTGGVFPYGTLVVNTSGALVIGVFAAMSLPEGRFLVPPSTRLFVMTGICGGYTTFSTFSLETLNLMRDGEWSRALGNIVGSVVLSLFAVWLGYFAALKLNTRG
jgi:CrcB protein